MSAETEATEPASGPAVPPSLPGSGPVAPPPLPSAAPAGPAAPAPTGSKPGDALLVTTCASCGSQIVYEPGTVTLKCSSCGREQPIAPTGAVVHEHAYTSFLKSTPPPVASVPALTLSCAGCGAKVTTTDLASLCAHCGDALVAVSTPAGLLTPEAVVPFGIDRAAASAAVTKWTKSRWFAPRALKKVNSTESAAGQYLPHFTFDAHTESDYTGARGEHYWETETYTDAQGHQQTRQVMKTRWWPTSGHVSRDFDDLLVPATTHLADKLPEAGPWPLEQAMPYRPEYLAGYTAPRYDVDVANGLDEARERMAPVIESDARSDIGGDEQRVNSVHTSYSAIMFKLLLLPLWLATYIYAGKTYHVVINANTGEVSGERPYSKVKIALAVIAVIIVIVAVVLVVLLTRHHPAATRPGS